jgi:uncharacterized membrane protein
VTKAEQATIARAIAQAEDGTTGKIAVRVVPDKRVDAFERAKHEFGRIGLHRHQAQNAALILVAPNARQMAVLGDRTLHDRVGEPFWHEVVAESTPYFARGDAIGGITHAIARVGQALHAHFPAAGGGAA